MKVFIVFLALIVLFSGIFSFRTDMDRYMLLQRRLKVLAEDCAEAAAMCIDTRRSKEEGRMIIDLGKGQLAAEKLIESSALMDAFAFGGARLQVLISPEGASGVRADVSWQGPDLFRLSFITKKAASRSAAYEWLD